MKLDETLIEIIEQVRKETKEKYNIELSFQEVYECINSQMEATKLGFSKGVTVVWTKFCKFVFSNRGVRKKDVRTTLYNLEVNEDISPEVREQLKKDKVISAAEEKRKYLATKKEKSVSAREVIKKATMTRTDIVLFKTINKKKTK